MTPSMDSVIPIQMTVLINGVTARLTEFFMQRTDLIDDMLEASDIKTAVVDSCRKIVRERIVQVVESVTARLVTPHMAEIDRLILEQFEKSNLLQTIMDTLKNG